MLSLFRKNSFFNSLLMLFYAIILQLIPALKGSAHGFLGEYTGSTFLGSVLHIFILFLQAIFINRLVIENRLHRDIMLFPGVFFILFSSLLPEFWSPSHIHFADFIVIWALFELFQIYKMPNPAVHIFNSAFLIGVASLICPPMIWYLLVIFIGISNLKKIELVHPLQIFIGGGVPWFLWITYHIWKGEGSTFWTAVKNHWGFNLTSLLNERSAWWHTGLFALIIILTFLLYNEFRKKKHIQAQKKIDILYVTLAASLVCIVFHRPPGTNNLIMTVPMIGIFIGLLFSHSKRSNFPELIHMLLFFGVLIMQIFYYFNFV
jgi:hypothetical protein